MGYYTYSAFDYRDEIVESADGKYDRGALSIGFDYNIKKRIAIGSSWDIMFAKKCDEVDCANDDAGDVLYIGFINIYGNYFFLPCVRSFITKSI